MAVINILTILQGNATTYASVAASAARTDLNEQPQLGTRSPVRSPTTTPRKRKAKAPLSGLPSPDAQEGAPEPLLASKSPPREAHTRRRNTDAFSSTARSEDVSANVLIEQAQAAIAAEGKLSDIRCCMQ